MATIESGWIQLTDRRGEQREGEHEYQCSRKAAIARGVKNCGTQRHCSHEREHACNDPAADQQREHDVVRVARRRTDVDAEEVGPRRELLESGPQHGDRRNLPTPARQMNPLPEPNAERALVAVGPSLPVEATNTRVSSAVVIETNAAAVTTGRLVRRLNRATRVAAESAATTARMPPREEATSNAVPHTATVAHEAQRQNEERSLSAATTAAMSASAANCPNDDELSKQPGRVVTQTHPRTRVLE